MLEVSLVTRNSWTLSIVWWISSTFSCIQTLRLRSISLIIDKCLKNPYKNNGRCRRSSGKRGFICRCRLRFTGSIGQQKWSTYYEISLILFVVLGYPQNLNISWHLFMAIRKSIKYFWFTYVVVLFVIWLCLEHTKSW